MARIINKINNNKVNNNKKVQNTMLAGHPDRKKFIWMSVFAVILLVAISMFLLIGRPAVGNAIFTNITKLSDNNIGIPLGSTTSLNVGETGDLPIYVKLAKSVKGAYTFEFTLTLNNLEYQKYVIPSYVGYFDPLYNLTTKVLTVKGAVITNDLTDLVGLADANGLVKLVDVSVKAGSAGEASAKISDVHIYDKDGKEVSLTSVDAKFNVVEVKGAATKPVCDDTCGQGVCGWKDIDNTCKTGALSDGTWCCHRECSKTQNGVCDTVADKTSGQANTCEYKEASKCVLQLTKETDCANGVDDDNDKLVDCADSDCNSVSGGYISDVCKIYPYYGYSCKSVDQIQELNGVSYKCFLISNNLIMKSFESNCNNKIDDDKDGITDCDDPDCAKDSSCLCSATNLGVCKGGACVKAGGKWYSEGSICGNSCPSGTNIKNPRGTNAEKNSCVSICSVEYSNLCLSYETCKEVGGYWTDVVDKGCHSDCSEYGTADEITKKCSGGGLLGDVIGLNNNPSDGCVNLDDIAVISQNVDLDCNSGGAEPASPKAGDVAGGGSDKNEPDSCVNLEDIAVISQNVDLNCVSK